MPTIFVDNKPYMVSPGQNMLQACLSLGFDIPYYCWHPALNSVGACRMCAVKQFKDANDTKGKIVMSCMTPANDGTRISIDDQDAVKFRKRISEWLMINHPHDCPVCDEGGECHLQDMTLLTGHVYRRYRFDKRTHTNQNLGPFITHEMNRCIQCYRCVRYYNDYAGGRDLGVFCWHDHVYFGRSKDGVLKSQFAGNLVEICPTGVFTDKTLARHYTRKWDLQNAPSICPHCSLGCNTIPGERYGTLRRIRNRYNSHVNGYFLCDRGRFGYEFVNSGRRIKRPFYRQAKKFELMAKDIIVEKISEIIKASRNVIGIGSPRASLESNYSLRTLVGPHRFYNGLSETQTQVLSTITEILKNSPLQSASLSQIGMADAVFILGEDVSNSAPMIELALRQAALTKPSVIPEKMHIEKWNDYPFREAIGQEKSPIYIATCNTTVIDEIAKGTYRASPDDIARLGFAVAHEIDAQAPAIGDISKEMKAIAKMIAEDLKAAQRPLVISGTMLKSRSLIQAAANVAYALEKTGKKPLICFAPESSNSIGMGLLEHKSINSAVKAAERGPVDAVIILENDIYNHVDSDTAEQIFKAVKNIIVIDSMRNQTTLRANFVLPAAAYAESDGTFVNNEARAQRFFKVFVPAGDIKESWQWFRDIMLGAGISEADKWKNFDGIVNDIASKLPVFKDINKITPRADFRIAGQKIPRQPHRYSGRTAMYANIDVREHKTIEDNNSPLSFSMEGFDGRPPSSLITHFWAPSWNSVQSVNKFQDEIAGPLRGGDPGIKLIEPQQQAAGEYFKEIPNGFKINDDELLILPAAHVFGSEEQSAISPSIAELAPKPYITVNPADAERLVINNECEIEITLSGVTHLLGLESSTAIPNGIAIVPAGLKDLQWDGLPVRVKLKRR